MLRRIRTSLPVTYRKGDDVRRLLGVRGGGGGSRTGLRRALGALGVLATVAVIAASCTRNPPPGGTTTTRSTRPPVSIPGIPGTGASWTMWGKDFNNSHFQNAER